MKRQGNLQVGDLAMEKCRVLKRAFGKWYEKTGKSASRGLGYRKMQSFEGLAHQVLAKQKENRENRPFKVFGYVNM